MLKMNKRPRVFWILSPLIVVIAVAGWQCYIYNRNNEAFDATMVDDSYARYSAFWFALG
jgi:hypothetical protein